MDFFLFDYIDPFVFLLALFVGLAYTYVTTPPPRVIVKYPTPFNIKDTVYQDVNGVCYRYKIREVDCPRNRDQVTHVLPEET
jgi:hypothetical protein